MEKISALIITYNPTYDLTDMLDFLYEYFDHIILVDNNSGPEIRAVLETQIRRREARLKVIFNPTNLGIATALNQGFSLAIQLGYGYLITLDQDSTPDSGMIDILIDAYQNHPNQINLAILAPDIIENALGKPSRYIRQKHYFFFERSLGRDEFLRNVSFVITSGSMHNLNLYEKIGPFRDDFFIDAVDTEYCLRAIAKGYEISVACNAHLEHHLGNRQQKKFLGKTHSPTFHPPFRWYYISRNRIAMIRLYGWRYPHWLFYEILITLTSLIRMLVFENQRVLKIKAFLYGMKDGLLGRMGEIPVGLKRALIPAERA